MNKLGILVFLLNVIGQATQNLCLPLALSGGDDMGAVFVYTAFIYFIFFAVLDVLFDVFMPQLAAFHSHEKIVSQARTWCWIGFQNALNGLGAIFGGSSDRTPLTLQMTGSLLINMLAPFYKMWIFRIPFSSFFSMKKSYLLAFVLYTAAFVLTLVDKLQNHVNGSSTGFCVLFWAGCFFGVTYNVHQDQAVLDIFDKKSNSTPTSYQKLSSSETESEEETFVWKLRQSVSLLRRQLTWLFLFSWLGTLLSFIPGFDQSKFTSSSFEDSWASFLPFGNLYINLFNLGYIVCFITSVFMNHFDSSFNMMSSNLSAVSILWAGWIPSLQDQTVGFYPNVAMTTIAILLSCLAIWPSYLYGLQMQEIVKTHSAKPLAQVEPQVIDRTP